eukprot:CAMPEP_0185157814 /NCGR_PEP_ID=MMETSP1139-20130426/2016_1 /TAXON_ID=298111 /ORGANISM="Pavlova sp., Strain CCMP459" /LENGTH=195 /DNA_ID=CAMNT_0027722919 /DNA_START=222 /DNA_END=811 /DNA_ORIENTATION=+
MMYLVAGGGALITSNDVLGKLRGRCGWRPLSVLAVSALPQITRHNEGNAKYQAHCVQKDEHQHTGAQCLEACLEERVFDAAFVQAEEHGKADDEVDAIECGAHGVGHVAILKRVVRVRRDGERLHEGSEVREGEHRARGEDEAHKPRAVAGGDLAQEEVGEGVVGGEKKCVAKVMATGTSLRRHEGMLYRALSTV